MEAHLAWESLHSASRAPCYVQVCTKLLLLST